MEEVRKKYTWHLEYLEIKKLKPHPKNPRQIHKHQFEYLSKLIDKYGMIQNPIINKDGMIIGGHQRIKIAKKNKEKMIECLVADELLIEDDVNELCIGLNLHQGSFDYDILANQWEPLDLLQYGFTEEKLLGHYEKKTKQLEEKAAKTKTSKKCPACGHEF